MNLSGLLPLIEEAVGDERVSRLLREPSGPLIVGVPDGAKAAFIALLAQRTDAPVHLTVIDPETGKVAEYSPELRAGESISFDFPAGEMEPAATREDGETLKPTRFELHLEGGEAVASSGGGGFSFTSPLVLAEIAAALVVVAVALFVLRRPHPR